MKQYQFSGDNGASLDWEIQLNDQANWDVVSVDRLSDFRSLCFERQKLRLECFSRVRAQFSVVLSSDVRAISFESSFASYWEQGGRASAFCSELRDVASNRQPARLDFDHDGHQPRARDEGEKYLLDIQCDGNDFEVEIGGASGRFCLDDVTINAEQPSELAGLTFGTSIFGVAGRLRTSFRIYVVSSMPTLQLEFRARSFSGELSVTSPIDRVTFNNDADVRRVLKLANL